MPCASCVSLVLWVGCGLLHTGTRNQTGRWAEQDRGREMRQLCVLAHGSGGTQGRRTDPPQTKHSGQGLGPRCRLLINQQGSQWRQRFPLAVVIEQLPIKLTREDRALGPILRPGRFARKRAMHSKHSAGACGTHGPPHFSSRFVSGRLLCWTCGLGGPGTEERGRGRVSIRICGPHPSSR